MGDFDQVEGEVKEQAGKLTDDESLEKEGKVQQTWGDVKEKAEDLGDESKEKFEDVKEEIDERI
jgi:uncharacterized protein YjbJ (UPF0337 family)